MTCNLGSLFNETSCLQFILYILGNQACYMWAADTCNVRQRPSDAAFMPRTAYLFVSTYCRCFSSRGLKWSEGRHAHSKTCMANPAKLLPLLPISALAQAKATGTAFEPRPDLLAFVRMALKLLRAFCSAAIASAEKPVGFIQQASSKGSGQYGRRRD